MSALAGNFERVRAQIAAACAVAGREPSEVELVAVSKRHPAAAVAAALATGQRVFGENRVQELKVKASDFAGVEERGDETGGIQWHLIGPLQTNKVREAVRLFDVIQTLDRQKLAEHLVQEMDRSGHCPSCLIQVNVGEEPQKTGIWPEEADDLVQTCRDDLNLPIVGLMCIPPMGKEPSPYFALLRTIAERNGLAELSMGMSGDYEAAVELGATLVRVGTEIFGEREGP